MDSGLVDIIVDRIDDGVFVLNHRLEVQLWNRFMQSHSGYSSSDILGKNICEVFPEIPMRWFKRKVDSVFILKNQAFTSWQQRPYLLKFPHNRHLTGGVDFMYQSCVLIPMIDSMGDVQSVCVVIHDVTDEAMSQTMLEAANERLEYISHIDALTQLYNRGYWEKCLAREFKRYNRHGGVSSLVMMDLDHFKEINDTYGHVAGDQVLRKVADIILETIRETDIAGRYGGEEFCLIMTGASLEGTKTVVERIRQNVSNLCIVHKNMSIKVTISIGVAAFDSSIENYKTLIAKADQALYQSKENGRNQMTLG